VSKQTLATSGSDGGEAWQVSYYRDSFSCSIKLSGIAILANPSNSNGCASGLVFYYSDGSSYTVGENLGYQTPTLSFSNPGGLTNVNNFNGGIVDLLQLCTSSTCIVGGNTGGRSISSYASIGASKYITGFYGSFSNGYSSQNCFAGFGIYYK
jgi:hypothetical protein